MFGLCFSSYHVQLAHLSGQSHVGLDALLVGVGREADLDGGRAAPDLKKEKEGADSASCMYI